MGNVRMQADESVRFYAHDFPHRDALNRRIDSSSRGDVLEIDVEKARLDTAGFLAVLGYVYSHKSGDLDVQLSKGKCSFSFQFNERLADPLEVVVGSMSSEPEKKEADSDERKKWIWPVTDTVKHQWIFCEWRKGEVYLLKRNILLHRFLEITDRDKIIVSLYEGGLPQDLKDFFAIVERIRSQKKVVDMTFSMKV